MNVLPIQASLGSFFVVLVVVLIITFLFALNLHGLLQLLRQGRRQFLTFISTSLKRSPKPLSLYDELLDDEKAKAQTGQPADGSEPWWTLLVDLFTFMPVSEMVYALRLCRRPRVPFYEKVRFSYGKLIGDVLRLLLLPMWIALVILGGFGQIILAAWRFCRRGDE